MEREHLEIKAMVARVHAETAAALAAEEAEVHETCAHCGHTKYDKWMVEAYAQLAIRNKIEEPYLTYIKSIKPVPKADDPK